MTMDEIKKYLQRYKHSTFTAKELSEKLGISLSTTKIQLLRMYKRKEVKRKPWGERHLPEMLYWVDK